jgi:hypothetical protein
MEMEELGDFVSAGRASPARVHASCQAHEAQVHSIINPLYGAAGGSL